MRLQKGTTAIRFCMPTWSFATVMVKYLNSAAVPGASYATTMRRAQELLG